MPERPPVAPRQAQPPGKTFLDFSPDGQRLLVAGSGNYARSFRTNDDGEPDIVNDVHHDTLATVCGVSTLAYPTGTGPNSNMSRTTMQSLAPKMVLSANSTWLQETKTT